MKNTVLLARFLAIIATFALLSGCAPIPVNPPRVLTPTTEIFLPGVAAPGVDTSPLQPTAVLTVTVPAESTPVAPTEAPSATVALPTATPLPTLVGPVWQWVSSTFKDGTVLAPGDPTRYTFQLLGDGNALVQADCNFGTGSYQESGSSISFGAIGTTKMACPPDSLDSAFLAQLANAAAFTVEGSQAALSLKDDAGTMLLAAAPGEDATAAPTLPAGAVPTEAPTATPPAPATIPLTTPTPLPVLPSPVPLGTAVPLPTAVVTAAVLPGLDGTAWLLASLTANGQEIPPAGTLPVTLNVAPDGARLSGFTGCNDYRATLREDDGGIAVVAPALMTLKACAANLMVQEVEFIDSLLRARSYLLAGNQLTLLDSSARPLAVFVRK